jgi:hypothetical protein
MMKIFVMTIGAAALVALAGSLQAEQELSAAQMDDVTAAGFAGGFSFANAVGANVFTNTVVETNVNSVPFEVENADPQAGEFFRMYSNVSTLSESVNGGVSSGAATGGTAVGDFESATASGFMSMDGEGQAAGVVQATRTDANTGALSTYGRAYNSSTASSLLGVSSASSSATSASVVNF